VNLNRPEDLALLEARDEALSEDRSI